MGFDRILQAGSELLVLDYSDMESSNPGFPRQTNSPFDSAIYWQTLLLLFWKQIASRPFSEG